MADVAYRRSELPFFLCPLCAAIGVLLQSGWQQSGEGSEHAYRYLVLNLQQQAV